MCRLLRKLEVKAEVQRQRHLLVILKLPTEAGREGMGRMEFVKLYKGLLKDHKETLTHISNTKDYKHERTTSKHCLVAGDFSRNRI